MQWARGRVERPGVDQRETPLPGGDHRQLGEANIVADCYGYFAIFREVDEGQGVTWGENVRLAEGDTAWDVDVEEVDLAVGR